MKKLKTLAALATACCLASTAAFAGGLTLVHPFQEGTEGEQWAREFADCVDQNSGIPVEVLPRDYFGSLSELSRAVSSGKLDMAILPASIIAEDWPLLDVFAVPSVLGNPDEILRASTDTDILNTIDELGSSEFGLFVLGLGWQYQLLALTAGSDRAGEAGQLDGLKIRGFGDRQSDFLAKLGASPMRLPGSEVPFALSAGVIDGAVLNLDQLAQAGKERQLSKLFWPNQSTPFRVPFAIVISSYADSSWGKGLRFDVRKGCADVINDFNQRSFEAAAELVDQMRSEDIEIVEDDLSDWRDVSGSLLETFASEADAGALFNQLVGN